MFDLDKGGSISKEELMNGLKILQYGSNRDKLKFLFDVFDVVGKKTLSCSGHCSPRKL